ncbi:MAG: 30S ribosomal protein S20 [Chlamydiales bacterium]|nr:30S ribosomal protein S20 [Chlamydiales bacterium]
MTKDPKAKKPRRPTPLKRDDQAEKRRLINKSFKSRVRTAIKTFDETLSKADAATKKANLNEIYSLMDQGVKKGIYKINTASRTKSRVAARFAAHA